MSQNSLEGFAQSPITRSCVADTIIRLLRTSIFLLGRQLSVSPHVHDRQAFVVNRVIIVWTFTTSLFE